MNFIQFKITLLGAITIILLSISCDQTDFTDNKTQNDTNPNELNEQQFVTFDDYLKYKNKEIENSNKTYTVQHTTLEEVNAEMIKYGLEPYSKNDIEKIKLRRSCGPFPCTSWDNHADWNGDFNVSTYDLIQADIYVKNFHGSTTYYGGYIDDVFTKYNDGVINGKALDFAQLSVFNCQGGSDILDIDDTDACRDYILLRITCI